MPALSFKTLLAIAPFLAFASGSVLEYRKNHSGGGSTTASNGTCTSIPQYLSCENTVSLVSFLVWFGANGYFLKTTITDTCCTPTPGGLVLQTQVRVFTAIYLCHTDIASSSGIPTLAWKSPGKFSPRTTGQSTVKLTSTLEPTCSTPSSGLWPDNCDGSFESYCDFSRQYDKKPR